MSEGHGYREVRRLATLSKAGASVWKDGGAIRVDIPPGATAAANVVQDVTTNDGRSPHESSLLSRRTDLLVSLTAGSRGPANVVCVNASHGTVFDYRHVAAHVDSRFPVYGLHSVRRLVTQGMPATLHEMAEAHVAELLENGICNVPFLLYGVSGGGYLAIEIAIQLQRRGIEPLAVVLGDTRDFAAQRGPVDDHLQERYLWLSFVAAYLPAPLLEAMLSPGGEGLWAEKGDEARALFLIERTKVLGDQTFALPLDAAIFVRHLSDHRTYMRAYSSHRPRSYGGRSVYVKATRIGWEFSSEIRSCLSAHSVVEISGNHWALVDERGGGIVAGILGEEMQQARTRPVRATRAVN